MWISKKEWMGLKKKVDKMEFDLKNHPDINGVTAYYADNVMVHQELRIFLEGRDLCKLQNQEFYPALMKFLDSL